MFDTRPTSPFGTHFEFPTLEQMICVCMSCNSEICHLYVNGGENDSEYHIIKFKDNMIIPESLNMLNDFDIKPSDPVTSADYSDGEWTFIINV